MIILLYILVYYIILYYIIGWAHAREDGGSLKILGGIFDFSTERKGDKSRIAPGSRMNISGTTWNQLDNGSYQGSAENKVDKYLSDFAQGSRPVGHFATVVKSQTCPKVYPRKFRTLLRKRE